MFLVWIQLHANKKNVDSGFFTPLMFFKREKKRGEERRGEERRGEERRGEKDLGKPKNIQRKEGGRRQLSWNQGFRFGSQPFPCVMHTLLSFLTLSMVVYLKKPECQTNLEGEVQPKGRGLFIGIVEQQLPAAIEGRVRAEPFHFSSLLCPPVFLSVLFFSLVPLSVSPRWEAH